MRHDVIEFKWNKYSHLWCYRGPPVPKKFNSNLACHVYPTTNTLYKLFKIHWCTHPLVGLGDDYFLKIVIWEHNKKQLKQ